MFVGQDLLEPRIDVFLERLDLGLLLRGETDALLEHGREHFAWSRPTHHRPAGRTTTGPTSAGWLLAGGQNG